MNHRPGRGAARLYGRRVALVLVGLAALTSAIAALAFVLAPLIGLVT